MADCVDPLMKVALCMWHSTARRASYILNLKDNLKSLEEAMSELRHVENDVQRRVEREEEHKMRRTDQVAGWLYKVQQMEVQVNQILKEGEENDQQKRCLGGKCCPSSCRTSYKVGKQAFKMTEEVYKLINARDFDAVADKVCILVDELPVDNILGQDSKFQEVWRCIEDQSLGIICLYGMGGIGKTTLLKNINNNFTNTSHGFDVVIWVFVSREPNLERIQECIRNKLDIPDYIWVNKNRDERANEIFRILKRKRFVVLLDDIWKPLDLLKLGIPVPNNGSGSKVVFTTRSEEVCGLMEAVHKIKIQHLPPDEALKLFKLKAFRECQNTTLHSHPHISKLAEAIAEECKGLPLALITVGHVMASRNSLEQWENELSRLKNSPSEFPGMTDVLRILKYSFDALQDATLKSCFLYCSMFPVEYSIKNEELIDLWIGEGFLNESTSFSGYQYDNLYEVRRRGEFIIESLKLAGLLDTGDSVEFVRMHDMIRDMALMECRGKIIIFIKRNEGLVEAHGIETSSEEVERTSLWVHSLKNISIRVLPYPKMRTLLFRVPEPMNFPPGYFLSMPKLSVLDMSNCFLLKEVPVELGELINLQYLNLSGTSITELPVELKNLTNLRCLLLSSCNIITIPGEIISNLQALQLFSKSPEYYFYFLFNDEIRLLNELENLKCLSDLCITIHTANSVLKVLSSHKLQQSLRKLVLWFCNGLTSFTASSSSVRMMKHLQSLELLSCTNLERMKVIPETEFTRHDLFHSLREVVVKRCPLPDVTWLICAPRLKTLSLVECKLMEQVIGDDVGCSVAETAMMSNAKEEGIFSSLSFLKLHELPKLRSICQQALLFPSLTKIEVKLCPNLKKLPFDSNSAKNSLTRIRGEAKWWDGLEWEDHAVKNVFSQKFVESPEDK